MRSNSASIMSGRVTSAGMTMGEPVLSHSGMARREMASTS